MLQKPKAGLSILWLEILKLDVIVQALKLLTDVPCFRTILLIQIIFRPLPQVLSETGLRLSVHTTKVTRHVKSTCATPENSREKHVCLSHQNHVVTDCKYFYSKILLIHHFVYFINFTKNYLFYQSKVSMIFKYTIDFDIFIK